MDSEVRATQVQSPDQDFLKFNLMNIQCRTDSLYNLPSGSSTGRIAYLTCCPAAGRIATALMNTKSQIISKQSEINNSE